MLGLEVGGLEQRVDGVLLGRLDEAAGVDHDGVGVLGVVDEHEAAGLEPAGQLLGVDLVAGAAEGHHGDASAGSGRLGLGRQLSGGHRTREYAGSGARSTGNADAVRRLTRARHGLVEDVARVPTAG